MNNFNKKNNFFSPEYPHMRSLLASARSLLPGPIAGNQNQSNVSQTSQAVNVHQISRTADVSQASTAAAVPQASRTADIIPTSRTLDALQTSRVTDTLQARVPDFAQTATSQAPRTSDSNQTPRLSDGSEISLHVKQELTEIFVQQVENAPSSSATYITQTPQSTYNTSEDRKDILPYNLRPRAAASVSAESNVSQTNSLRDISRLIDSTNEQTNVPVIDTQNDTHLYSSDEIVPRSEQSVSSPQFYVRNDMYYTNQNPVQQPTFDADSAYNLGSASNTTREEFLAFGAHPPKKRPRIDVNQLLRSSSSQPLDLTRENLEVPFNAQMDLSFNASLQDNLNALIEPSTSTWSNVQPHTQEEINIGKTLLDLQRTRSHNLDNFIGRNAYANVIRPSQTYSPVSPYLPTYNEIPAAHCRPVLNRSDGNNSNDRSFLNCYRQDAQNNYSNRVIPNDTGNLNAGLYFNNLLQRNNFITGMTPSNIRSYNANSYLNNYSQDAHNNYNLNSVTPNNTRNYRNMPSSTVVNHMQVPSVTRPPNVNIFQNNNHIYQRPQAAYNMPYVPDSYGRGVFNGYAGQNFNHVNNAGIQQMQHFVPSTSAVQINPIQGISNLVDQTDKNSKTRGPQKRKYTKQTPAAQQQLDSEGRPQKRTRTTFATWQTAALEVEFAKSRYCNQAGREALAKTLRLTDTQVKVWFQNRRTRWKKNNPGLATSTKRTRADINTINSAAFRNPICSELGLTSNAMAEERSSSVIPETPESMQGHRSSASTITSPYTQNQGQLGHCAKTTHYGAIDSNPTSFVYNSNLNNGGSYTVNLPPTLPSSQQNSAKVWSLPRLQTRSDSSSPEIIGSSFDRSNRNFNGASQTSLKNSISPEISGSNFDRPSRSFSGPRQTPHNSHQRKKEQNLESTFSKNLSALNWKYPTGKNNFNQPMHKPQQPEVSDSYSRANTDAADLKRILCSRLLQTQAMPSSEDQNVEASPHTLNGNNGFNLNDSNINQNQYNESPEEEPEINFSEAPEIEILSEMTKFAKDIRDQMNQNLASCSKDYSLQSVAQMAEQYNVNLQDTMPDILLKSSDTQNDISRQTFSTLHSSYQNNESTMMQNHEFLRPNLMELNATNGGQQITNFKKETYGIFENGKSEDVNYSNLNSEGPTSIDRSTEITSGASAPKLDSASEELSGDLASKLESEIESLSGISAPKLEPERTVIAMSGDYDLNLKPESEAVSGGSPPKLEPEREFLCNGLYGQSALVSQIDNLVEEQKYALENNGRSAITETASILATFNDAKINNQSKATDDMFGFYLNPNTIKQEPKDVDDEEEDYIPTNLEMNDSQFDCSLTTNTSSLLFVNNASKLAANSTSTLATNSTSTLATNSTSTSHNSSNYDQPSNRTNGPKVPLPGGYNHFYTDVGGNLYSHTNCSRNNSLTSNS